MCFPFLTVVEEDSRRGRKRKASLNNVYGNYKLKHKLNNASGSQKVWKAIDMRSRASVALKLIHHRDRDYKHIARETAILKNMEHPNIIRLLDYFEFEDNTKAMVMELAEKDLYLKIVEESNGFFSEKQSRMYFRQLVAAVDYCHKSNIAHKDLKLENILLFKNGTVKLTDFGFATAFESGKPTTHFCGSPVYAAPEVVQNMPYNAVKSDMWSLGVILYIFVFGEMPWRIQNGYIVNIVEMLAAKYTFPDNVTVSAECKDLIVRLLRARPEDRATLDEVRDHTWMNIGFGDKVEFIEPKVKFAPTQSAMMVSILSGGLVLSSAGSTSSLASTPSFNNLPALIKSPSHPSVSITTAFIPFPPSPPQTDMVTSPSFTALPTLVPSASGKNLPALLPSATSNKNLPALVPSASANSLSIASSTLQASSQKPLLPVSTQSTKPPTPPQLPHFSKPPTPPLISELTPEPPKQPPHFSKPPTPPEQPQEQRPPSPVKSTNSRKLKKSKPQNTTLPKRAKNSWADLPIPTSFTQKLLRGVKSFFHILDKERSTDDYIFVSTTTITASLRDIAA